MNNYSVKDYKTTHFEYKSLDKIHGATTIDSLLRIFRQLKLNAQCVLTTLGEGQLGYIDLVLSDAAYTAIPNSAPFARPLDPRALIITATKEDEIDQQQVECNEKKQQYNACQAVEQVLREQNIDAIPAEYLDAFRNTDTDMINDSIPDLIQYLQSNFRWVTDQELSDKEGEVNNFSYDLATPVDSVFNRIKVFQDLCILTENQKTDRQLIQLAYLVFNKNKAFMDSLKTWNAKLLSSKIFANFKLHMREEHHALRQVGAL